MMVFSEAADRDLHLKSSLLGARDGTSLLVVRLLLSPRGRQRSGALRGVHTPVAHQH